MPNWEELKKLLPSGAKEGESLGGKMMGAVAMPQKYALNQAANAMGFSGNPDNSEESSQNIVEGIAGKLGIPEDSTVGNAAKAAGVAGLEVFADPLSMMPIGKIGKVAEKIPGVANLAEKTIERFPQVQKMFQVGEKIFPANNNEHALRIKKALEEAGHVEPNRALQNITEGNPFQR